MTCDIMNLSRFTVGRFVFPRQNAVYLQTPQVTVTSTLGNKQVGGTLFKVTMIKKCSICGKRKLFTQFGKDKHNKDGLDHRCKECARKRGRKSYYKNIEQKRDYSRKYRAEHKEQEREQNYERARKWRAENPEKVLAFNVKWRAENPERIRQNSRRWQIENPDKVREISRNHKARKGKNGGKITAAEEKWLFEFYNYTCLRCGRRSPEIKLTLDHVIPLALGGENSIENAQPLCSSCNSSKGAKPIDYRLVKDTFK